jgi:hypothetical protein
MVGGVNISLGYAMAYACWHRWWCGTLARSDHMGCHATFAYLQFIAGRDELPF